MSREGNPNQESIKSLEERFIGSLGSGEAVFDRVNSHIHSSPSLDALLPRALETVDAAGQEFIAMSVSHESPIGETSCIETSTDDKIIYAQRTGRTGLTRFVLERSASPTSELTVVMKKIPEGYILLTAYVGGKSEVEPWDARATQASTEFWSNHALVWGTEEIIPGTETQAPGQ